MTIPELMIAIANRLKAVEIAGLNVDAIHYPIVNTLDITPAVMIRQRREDPTRVTRQRAAGQTIDVGIEIIVLVKATDNQPRDESRIDPLIAPIIDAFDPDASGEDIGDMLDVNSDEIDHVWSEAVVTRTPVEWVGINCYAAYIGFDAVIRHRPIAPTLRG